LKFETVKLAMSHSTSADGGFVIYVGLAEVHTYRLRAEREGVRSPEYVLEHRAE
jgi:hypothetical protein